jgi:RNA polymerase sigma-70 factor (ECF subfamily)
MDPRESARKAASVSDVAGVLPWGRDESALVAELQSGSDAAFDWLVTHYHGPVFSLLYGMLGDSADAADCTQEVFLKAFRGIRGFRRGSSLKTWLYRIGVREALNHKRWRWRHSRQQVSLESERESEMGFAEPEAQTESPFDSMAAKELRETVQKALSEVPESYRAAVILRDLEGFSYEEISEVLEISVGTVKSRMMRGRRWLREILEPMLGAISGQTRSETVPAEAVVTRVGHSHLGITRHLHGRAVANRNFSEWTPESHAARFSAGGGK